MKLETFFEKFEQFADAPNAVAKMRELVLTLAVLGKLVPQDPNDEPADELIARIAKQRGAKKLNAYSPVDSDTVPFEAPYLWSWVRLGNLSLSSDSGWSPQCGSESRSGDEWGVLKVSAVSWGCFDPEANKALPSGMEPRPECEVHPGDFLLSRANTEELVARSVVVEQTPPRLMMSDKIVRFTFPDEIEKAFINLANLSDTSREYYMRNASGTSSSMKNIGREVMCNLPVAIPPLAEQKRIVAKVDELMALCDRLEAQQQERETRHAALARAALARFADAPTPANLPFLFHASFTVSPSDLRKSILTLAVQGKLVPQDPNDEPAVNNVERNEELGAQAPFEIPAQWAWSQLSQLADINGGFAFKSTDYTDEGTRVVRISDFDEFGFRDHNVVRHPYNSDLQKFTVAEKNILMAMTGGTVGKSYFVRSLPEPMVVNQRVATIKVSANANPSYIDVTIRSEMTQEVIRKAKNSTNDNISMGDIKGFAIPIPPLAEQRRIVAKVDHLMAMVDQLEIQLTTARATAANLLDAIVAELTGTTRDLRSATRSSSSTPGTGRRGRPRKTA